MLRRIFIPMLAAAGLAFACGPRGSGPLAKVSRASEADGTVVSHVAVDTANGSVGFVIEVSNETGKRVEMTFPDGRTHDFIVLDSAGREVWRWSAGRMFTQSIQNRLIDAHDSVIYRERWEPEGPGSYTLVAQLHSENYPMQQRVEFLLH